MAKVVSREPQLRLRLVRRRTVAKGRFDPVAGADVDPVFGREVVERQHGGPVLGQAVHGLGVFGLIARQRAVKGVAGGVASLGHPHVMQIDHISKTNGRMET